MTLEEIRAAPAIDFHSHFGEWNVEPRFMPSVERDTPISIEFLLYSSRLSKIALSIVSHFSLIFPRGGGDIGGNDICLEKIEKLDSVVMHAVLNPLVPGSFEQTARLLKAGKCMGIKIHPEEHCYPIKKYGATIYEFAAKQGAMIVTHSGEENSMPEDFCVFANRYPEVKTIISHMCCGWDGNLMHQAKAIERSVHGNLFTDTSSAQSMFCRLLENYVREIGPEKILFGTDSGCYFSPAQRARVDCADISDDAELDILYRNGLCIFPQLTTKFEKACTIMGVRNV
jgi:predicted TIM-barrel fold metal-dependent hydrolase